MAAGPLIAIASSSLSAAAIHPHLRAVPGKGNARVGQRVGGGKVAAG
jgi:hypothetical protein